MTEVGAGTEELAAAPVALDKLGQQPDHPGGDAGGPSGTAAAGGVASVRRCRSNTTV